MSFDRKALIDACHAHGTVSRVVVAAVRGSAPRDVGAAMLVWKDGFSGTIGGGTLEFEAIKAAQSNLTPGAQRLSRHALGPDLGQCCGGAVELWTDCFDAQTAKALPDDLVIRGPGEMPLSVARLKARARDRGQMPGAQLVAGWMVEPVLKPERQIWIWGAGHVGRAFVGVLSPLPQIHLTWVDTNLERFPETYPDGVDVLTARAPNKLVAYAPAQAEHLVLTYSHDLDLALCHSLLRHDFAFAGLIGSKTKWARFKSRLRAMGHEDRHIDQITCPIGAPSLGKDPQAIAIGVGAALLQKNAQKITLEKTA